MQTKPIRPLVQALETAGVRLRINSRPSTITVEQPTTREGKPWMHYAWSVVLVGPGGESGPIPYKMGTAHVTKDKYNPKPVPPSCADVVHSMSCDSSACGESFKDWCDNLGYEEDSRTALKTYLACQESGQTLRRILGKHFSTIIEAAQDY